MIKTDAKASYALLARFFNLSQCDWNFLIPAYGIVRSTNTFLVCCQANPLHDDVIKWKHFPRNWPFVRGIHRSPVNSPHKGQWRGALMFTLICVWINGWVNNREAGDLRRYRAHSDVIVMGKLCPWSKHWTNIRRRAPSGVCNAFCPLLVELKRSYPVGVVSF